MRHQMTARGLPLLGLLALVACHKGAPGSGTSADAGAGTAAASAASSAQPAVVPARCKGAGAGAALVDAGGADELEIGDAVAVDGGGWAVGIVHRVGSSRMAAIAFLTAEATGLRVVDLAPTLGDAPPPHLAARGPDLLAGSYVVSKRPDVRELALYVVPKAGDPRVVATIPQQRDDSLAFDVAPGLVVWDEASTGPSPRGIIRAAELLPGDQVGPAHDVSPADSDAEMPRLEGSSVFWLARRPEAQVPDASAPAEAVGDVRAYSWLESSGTSPRRLTSASGHVSAYDVEPLAGGDALLVARDDGEQVDGSGGVLLRVRVHAAGSADPPLALPGDGLGRGAPIFIDGAAPWISWIGPHEAARLLPLDASGAPVGPPSAELELDDARPLAFLRGSSAPRILAAAPGDATAQLRVLACSQP
ncbi:MAG TPA: hypothetical protein VMI75_26855 [Polyangiaceae bacterium]|nr:hypothetical protein [Polyangiaceae bacterium]